MALVLLCTTSIPVLSTAAENRLPITIIDTHGHLNGDMNPERLVELMDRAGVQKMVLMARLYGGDLAAGHGSDRQALDFARKYPGRFIPFVAGQRPGLIDPSNWTSPGQNVEMFLRRTEEKLKTGEFFGLGEFILRHHSYSNFGNQGGGEVEIPVDSELMHRIARLAARYHVPVLFHAEAEPPVVAQVRRLLDAHPDTRFIWAHNCGRNSTDGIRTFLVRHPQLVCDLAAMAAPGKSGYGHYWPRRTPWIHPIENGQGQLDPGMAKLFEEFADRFMIGTDAAHTPALRFHGLRVARFRQLLSQLTAKTARRIAHENAERIFAPPSRDGQPGAGAPTP